MHGLTRQEQLVLCIILGLLLTGWAVKAYRARIRRHRPPKQHNRNMHEVSFEEALVKIQAKDPRYHRDAYLFVREALDYTQKTIGKDPRGRIRHVTGQELLGGIREFALQQFGPMAKTVLEEWGIRCGQDFGEIVFNMVEVELAGQNRQGQPR